MSMIHNKKQAWELRSRSARKLACIRMKNEIQKHSKHLGGLFTTHDVVDESSWADIYFLSRAHRHRIYNGTVDAALYAYFEKCDSLAWDASEKILPSDFDDYKLSFTKIGNGYSTLDEPPESRKEGEKRAFGGLSRYDWIDQEKLRIADSGDVWVHPCVKFDFSYRFGVGMMATLACEKLNVGTLDDFVEAFLRTGEKSFIDESVKLSFPSNRAKDSSSVNAITESPEAWAPSILLRSQSKIEREELVNEIKEAPATSTAAKSL